MIRYTTLSTPPMAVRHNTSSTNVLTVDFFKTVFDALPEATYVKDRRGRYVYCNTAFATFLKTDRPSVIGKTAADFFEPDIVESSVALDRLVLRTKSRHTIEKKLTTETNEDQFLVISKAPLIDRSGKVIGIVGTIRNITRRKLNELQKDQFIGMVSHELKTPLTSIKAFSQLLRKALQENKFDQAQKVIKRMNELVDRLSHQTDELLDTTRIEAGTLSLQKSKLNICRLVTMLVQELQPTTSIPLVIKCKDTYIFVTADKDRLSQVIINLVSNAIKYAPQSPKIILSVRKTKDIVTITVQDFGPGIPKSKQAKIFERFYQLNKRAKNIGTGQGLYIAKEIIEAHGGTIGVTSIVGKGSRFYFKLVTSEN